MLKLGMTLHESQYLQSHRRKNTGLIQMKRSPASQMLKRFLLIVTPTRLLPTHSILERIQVSCCKPKFIQYASSSIVCGDNVNKTIKHRYIRINIHEGSISLHYFRAYGFGVADRFDFSKLSDTPPMSLGTEAQAFMILPSLEDDSDLEENFKILIARVLCENLPFFKETFDGVLTWHIKHCYYEEMSKKSDIVSCTPCMYSASSLVRPLF